MFVDVISYYWGSVYNSTMQTRPQPQMDSSITELGTRNKNISSWFPFSSNISYWLFRVSIPCFPFWTVLIYFIGFHSSSILSSQGLFWFHTHTIIIYIFCPDYWLYISVINISPLWMKCTNMFLCRINDIADLCPL